MAPPTITKEREPTDRRTGNEPGNMTNGQTRSVADTWPRFLVVEATGENQSISKLNPFIRAKALHGILGTDPRNVTLYKNSGLLCVEVDTHTQCNSLLQAKTFHNISIRVTPHKTKNYSKGVFFCDHLNNMTDEDILEELKHQGKTCIVEIHRIQSKRNGTLVPTGLFVASFSSPQIPKDVKIGDLNCKVRPYIPNPRRCFNCQEYGHSKTTCKHATVCAKCGSEGHEYETCTSDPHCLHCGGNHPASSKECPRWRTEKRILEIVHTEKVTFYEAKQRVNNSIPAANRRTLSDVVRGATKPETRTIAVQTSGTHCQSCTCNDMSSQTPSTSNATSSNLIQQTPLASDVESSNLEQNIASSPEDVDMDKISGKRYMPSSDEDEASSPDRSRSSTDPSAPAKGAKGSGPGTPHERSRSHGRSRSPILPPGRPPNQAENSSDGKKPKKHRNK